MRPSQVISGDGRKDQASTRSLGPSIASLALVLSSRAGTESLGQAIGRALRGGEVLALIGTLGAGKTTLVRGIAAGLGTPPDSVTSPTFVLVHEYRGRLPLIHIDLYRLGSGAEAESIGLHDYFTGHTVSVIEWADRFPGLLPNDQLEVRLTHRSPATREALLTARGPQSSRLLTSIKRVRRSIGRSSAPQKPKNAGRRKASTR